MIARQNPKRERAQASGRRNALSLGHQRRANPRIPDLFPNEQLQHVSIRPQRLAHEYLTLPEYNEQMPDHPPIEFRDQCVSSRLAYLLPCGFQRGFRACDVGTPIMGDWIFVNIQPEELLH